MLTNLTIKGVSMGYPHQGPSFWDPPGSRPPMHGTVFGPGGTGPGYDASIKLGVDGTPKQGHILINDSFQQSEHPNSKQFDKFHDHYGPGMDPQNRGAYRGPGSR